MMFHLPLRLLLFACLLVPSSCAVNPELPSWTDGNVPRLVDRNTVRLPNPKYSDGDSGDSDTACGIECQRNLPEPGIRELEHLLAYETLYKNGTRTLTEVQLQDMRNASFSSLATLSCRKRQVYGTDGRFVIADQRFITGFPFSASVKLSAGCSGILVSPKHVLTAAHCVHDGRRYRRGLKRLRVGVMALQKNRRRKDKLDGESRRKQRKTVKNSKQPALRWTRVQQTYVPRGWINDSGNKLTLDYDYALLKLKRRLRMKHMDLGVVPHVTRIHFSGFDDDHAGQVVYRFCTVTQESDNLMYQRCDAQRGSSGAGVYVRLRKTPAKAEGTWKRRVIGVFSGHRSVKEANDTHGDYNVAVKITPEKLAQIRLWIHGDAAQHTLDQKVYPDEQT